MLTKLQEQCNVIDVSQLRGQTEVVDDFDALIPSASVPVDAIDDIAEMEYNRREQIGKDALPEETFNQVLESCFKTGGYRGLRDATYLILQSNWGVRIGDCLEVKRFDFIDQNGQFRDKCLFHEQKTGKPRTMYINDTIKMCILMLLWTGKFNDPRSHLLVSDSPNKGYVKLRDENGKVKRINGKYAYATDADGNKIIEPVKYDAMAKMLQKRLVDDLGIELKNITREVPDDKKIQSQMKLAIATHSLRKLPNDVRRGKRKSHSSNDIS